MKLAALALIASPMLWFGTDDSYFALQDAAKLVGELEKTGQLEATLKLRAGISSSDPWKLPAMWELQGGDAIIHIDGSLIPGSAGFMRLFGVVGYDDIKMAISEALGDKSVKRVVLAINSGGGAVDGVMDAGDFIRKATLSKPVLSYASGTMASAAYWLGASASKVFASPTAQVGSVGTMTVQMERSKQLADAGVTAKVFRFGEYKALGNPYEPLTEKGAEQIQGLVDQSGQIFVEYVADRRGVTPQAFQKKMGEGRVFMGQQAFDVGLIDGVMSFESFISTKALDTTKLRADNPQQLIHSSQDPSMKKPALSKTVLLMIAAGTALESLGLSTPAANAEGTQLDAEGVATLTAEATEIHAAIQATLTKAASATAAKVTAEAQVTDLTAKVTELTSKVAILEAGAASLTAKVTDATGLAASMAAIVKASMSTMSVALGGSADVGATLMGAELVAEHDKMLASYKAKFKVGGLAAAGGAPEGESKPGVLPPSFRLLKSLNTARSA